MKTTARIAGVGGLALAATALLAGPAQASSSDHSAPVFVQTDNLAGNTIVAYDRAADGRLHQAGSYPTGGNGGALTGSVVDHLASQGSLASDRANGLLYAVNAGSDTVSVFAVHGDRLTRRQVITSGGTFPVSIAVRGNLLYVLNARDGGSVQGYLRIGDLLVRVPAWHRSLGLDPTQTPEFTNTPGPGRLYPGRPPARRHHQGQRQRHPRVRPEPFGGAVGPARGQRRPAARCRSRPPSTPAATWSSPRPRTRSPPSPSTPTARSPSSTVRRPGRRPPAGSCAAARTSTRLTPAAPACPATTTPAAAR